MQNYLSKQNLGMPAGIVCAMIYLLSYGITHELSYLLVGLIVSVVVFLFNFEEKVKNAVKQGIAIVSISYLVQWILEIVKTVVYWFDKSSAYNDYDYLFNEAAASGNKALSVIYKIILIVDDVKTILVIFILIMLLIAALQNKDKKIGFLHKVTAEKHHCPNCGTEISDGAAFCTKCGASLK